MRLLWQASVVTHVTDGYFLLIELLKRVSSLCLKTLSQVMFDRGKFPPILALTELLSQLSLNMWNSSDQKSSFYGNIII